MRSFTWFQTLGVLVSLVPQAQAGSLHGQGTIRSVMAILPLPTEQVRRMLPEGLELGSAG